VADPYRWLEDESTDETQAWSAAQAQRVDGLWRIEQQLASALKDESATIGRA